MRVQEIKLDNIRKRYLLVDDNGIPIKPVAKYLKYIDRREMSFNTQKTYAYSLKLYFEYLKENNLDYRYVNVDILSKFVSWLRSPYQNSKVISAHTVKAKRCESTVNLTITVVTNFYDYLFRTDEIENEIVHKLIKEVYSGRGKKYKGFLHHITKDNATCKNILKIKQRKRKVEILSKDDIQVLYNATTNIRDKFLIKLLFETGIRIGEALSLFIEDIICDHKNGHKIKIVYRGEHINNASQKTGQREVYISQELLDLFDDYSYEVLDEFEIDTNYIFVKIKGENIGKPLTYEDVTSLFKRLKDKTGINAHAHLFRHTHATIYYLQTKNMKLVQERLGHSQIHTTMDLYVHPSDEDKRDDWSNAKDAFKLN